MSSSLSLIKSSQIAKSYATALPGSIGKYGTRLILENKSYNKTKIAMHLIAVKFLSLLDTFFSRVLGKFGYQKKWVMIKLQEANGKTKEALLNINSLCNRTVLKRSEVLNKTPEQLSAILANPALVVEPYKKLKDYFPDAYLINLDSRPDRIEQLHEHLIEIGQSDFKFTRRSAILGKTLDASMISKMSKSQNAKKNGKDDRHGRIGCYLSHLNAIKEAKKNNLPQILVMEDDVRFMPNAMASSYISRATNELPKDWGMLFLGHFDAEKTKARSYSEHLVQPGCPYDLHAYVVNASMYDTLISALENELKKENGEMRAIDVVIGEDLVKTGRLFATKENVAIQDEGESSIVNGHVFGNYQRELKQLKSTLRTPHIETNKTVDGLPVMDPLMAGTIYQYFYHIDRIFEKHGIKWMIDGGTVLGAERHEALIPHDDDGDLVIAPGMEKILEKEEVKKDFEAVGLTIQPHVLGYKIYANKDHPLGKSHFKDGCHFKAPAIDIFVTKYMEIDGKESIAYGSEWASKIWPNYYYNKSDFFDEAGRIKRVQFGPITVNGSWNSKEVCIRNYGPTCLEEAYLQYDHIKEKAIASKPIKLTDFRGPAYREWEGVAPLVPSKLVKT